jgi:hypothetical protein
VQMRRLPEDQTLPTLLAKGSVTIDTIERLACLVAEFHARAEPAVLSTRPGRRRRSSRTGEKISNRCAPTSMFRCDGMPMKRFRLAYLPSVALENRYSASGSLKDASDMATATCVPSISV